MARALDLLQATPAPLLGQPASTTTTWTSWHSILAPTTTVIPPTSGLIIGSGSGTRISIDNRGFYRRFVVRDSLLAGLLQRVHTVEGRPADELDHEAATVLAGTMLMASGVSGAGPDTYDSSVNLAALMPRIAHYRDAFYNHHLSAISGSHGDRLRQEAKAMRQPFGGARQHINQYLSLERAAQLQQRHLALLMAELGYPDSARRHAARVSTASLRLLTEIHIHLTTCQILAEAIDMAMRPTICPRPRRSSQGHYLRRDGRSLEHPWHPGSLSLIQRQGRQRI